MLAANLKSSQEALAFLGRMQSLENSQEVYRKSKQEQNSKDFERTQLRVRDQGGSSGYRETPRDVRHARYGYQQSNPSHPVQAERVSPTMQLSGRWTGYATSTRIKSPDTGVPAEEQGRKTKV